MSDTINEQLSALVDGELPDAERELLQRRLETDDDLQGTWQRYHLIRDAMREDLPEFISRTSDTTYIQHDDDTRDEGGSPAPVGVIQRLARPAAGFAIAASVAMLAVFGVLYNNDSLSPQQTKHQIAASQPQPAPLPDNYLAVPRTGWKSARPAVVSHLNSYLVDHSSYSGFGASQSIIPYSRIAGYDQPMPDEELKENASKEDRRQ
ncbi:MAG: RseA family anti-sigma factor [Gammaproteobacteria bacterium]|nr:RseA family anti-sigma factor [Gammaproteobacteria bacterium]